MWIRRSEYARLLEHAFATTAEIQRSGVIEQELRARIAATDVTLDWLRIRCTQLERERATMIERYTGVKIDVPVIARAPEQTTPEILNEAAMFDDVGDEVARQLGIGWKLDGTIDYSKKS